jgi:phage terminase large subunit-like protein
VDWEARIVDRRSLIPFDPLFPDEAAAALAVFKSLRVVSLPGRPTFGDCGAPWVFDFVGAIFGAYDPVAAARLVNEFLLLISKKNIKSTIAAGIMVTALVRNWRPEAEALILAPTIEVANNSYGPAASMVRADEELSDLLHIQDNFRKITHLTTGAALKVVAANAETVSGKKAPFVLVEELHEFGKQPRAAAMLMEATGGQSAAPEGFTIYLTTQSDEPPAGVFKEKLDEFRGIRDGEITDPEKLPVLYEFPKAIVESEAYFDPANFYITNPMLDRSVRHSWLVKKLEEKRRLDKSVLNTWLAKHLNVEIGMRLRADRWPGADHWEGAAETGLTLAELLRRSEVVVMGGDGGGLDDLLGLAVLGREKETGRWLLWCRAWCYIGVLEMRKEIAARLRDFEAAGEMRIIDQLGDDMDDVEAIAKQVVASGLLPEKDCVGVDPAGVAELSAALQRGGLTSEQIVGVSQGWRLSGAIVTAERGLADGTLRHAGQALMAWCVSNAKLEPKGNARLITKAASASKIDPLMATLNAISLMGMNPQLKRKPTYQVFFA